MEQATENHEGGIKNNNSFSRRRDVFLHILLAVTYFSLGLILSPKLLPGIRLVSQRFVLLMNKQLAAKPSQSTATKLRYPTFAPTPTLCTETYNSDGKSIFFDKCGTSNILVSKIDTSKWPSELLLDANDVSVSPNSKSVAIQSSYGNEKELDNVMLYGSDLNGNLVKINNGQFYYSYKLFWSPSGRYLAYSKSPEVGPVRLAVYDFVTNKNVELHDGNITADFYNYDDSTVVWSQNEKSFSAKLYVWEENTNAPEGEELVFAGESVITLKN